MNLDTIYLQRLKALEHHLRYGVPFLKWKYNEVAQWDATDTVLVCGCAIAEASCLFRGENADLYNYVGAVASHPGRPFGEQRTWNKHDWSTMQSAIQEWFGFDKLEFNFLFTPLIDDDSNGSWFTEAATAIDIANGIKWLLDGNDVPERSEEELQCILNGELDDITNEL